MMFIVGGFPVRFVDEKRIVYNETVSRIRAIFMAFSRFRGHTG